MKEKNPMMQALLGLLSKNPKATYAECRAALERKGFTLYPITYGRGKALAGLVPVRPRGSGARPNAQASDAAVPQPGGKRIRVDRAHPARRAAGRAKEAPGSGGPVEPLIAFIKQLERERDEAREIIANVRRALG